ncbi:palmitoyltransferase ZDHHC2-like isoform X1 [Euwallacea similis]|uniref:palmitoyltransferase ZDHHC2-like isoform X1 n=1 Tax=Euwallacea similis TaxID=1736056 RepID=UPI00344EF83F
MSNAFIKNLPPAFLLILFAGSYFIYVYYFSLTGITSLHHRLPFLVVINLLAIMLLWSFLATMCSSVGKVPMEYKFSRDQHVVLIHVRSDDDKDDILERFCKGKDLLLETCTSTGSIRYCCICMHIKPDRTHHCSTCKICYLRMDHHCFWLNNCIGFYNYKSFILLIFYTFLYCFFYASTSLRHVTISVLDSSKFARDFSISVGFGAALLLGIATFGFLCYHLYLTGRNETTLENLYPPSFVEEDSTFDLGVLQNFLEVFSGQWYFWFLPVFSSRGSGHAFLVEKK